jgi:hypothetical protein
MTGKRSQLKPEKTAPVEEKLYFVIDKLSKLKCAAMFIKPVDDLLYPDYRTRVAKPMDF